MCCAPSPLTLSPSPLTPSTPHVIRLVTAIRPTSDQHDEQPASFLPHLSSLPGEGIAPSHLHIREAPAGEMRAPAIARAERRQEGGGREGGGEAGREGEEPRRELSTPVSVSIRTERDLSALICEPTGRPTEAPFGYLPLRKGYMTTSHITLSHRRHRCHHIKTVARIGDPAHSREKKQHR